MDRQREQAGLGRRKGRRRPYTHNGQTILEKEKTIWLDTRSLTYSFSMDFLSIFLLRGGIGS
jgi:hypothetical protein